MWCTHLCDGAEITPGYWLELPGFYKFLELHRSEANLDSANDDK